MSSFFSYFPTLLYSNTAVTNILAKVNIGDTAVGQIEIFHPYTVKEGERADQIANFFYEDSSLDWLIYLCNGIKDPLNEWPKSQNTMKDFINLKYGSEANAQFQTAYYRVNWEQDDSVISTAAYAALATNTKKYWAPIIGVNKQIRNYQRKPLSTVVETNQVIQLTGTFNGISVNDGIKQSSSVTGVVGFANSTTLQVKHTTGTWQTATPVKYALTDTTANATISSVTTIIQNIPLDEVAYWSAVSIYDIEHELNESRKIIKLIDTTYVNTIERDMKRLLS